MFGMRQPKTHTHNHTHTGTQNIVVGKNEWPACENLEKNYARARSTFPKLGKPARKVGGEAAHFWCPFLEFGGVGLART